jgi:hypothetical protein
MSQRSVERVIGRLVTDEGFRRRFIACPGRTLQSLIEQGEELNETELFALVAIDPAWVGRFAQTLHPSIQKADLEGGRS